MSTDKEEKKEKSKILEKEYQDKIVDTSYYAIRSAVTTAVITSFTVPIILWKLKFIPTSIEVRILSGLALSMPAGYFMALNSRKKSMEDIENNYTF